MKVFFKTLILVAATSAAPSSAFAADVNWTGAYVGMFTGYSMGNVDLTSDTSRLVSSGVFDHAANGMIAGVQAGADWQLNDTFVFGITGDVAYGDIGEDSSVILGAGGVPYTGTGPFNRIDMSTDVNYTATLRARAGYAFGSNLVYATGGMNILNHTGSSYVRLNGLEAHGSTTQSHVGWVIGAGIERQITEKMSVGALYLYSNSGDDRYVIDQTGAAVHGGSIQHIDLHYNPSTLRLNVNYRF
jgi:outer membrane immunogenic protein